MPAEWINGQMNEKRGRDVRQESALEGERWRHKGRDRERPGDKERQGQCLPRSSSHPDDPKAGRPGGHRFWGLQPAGWGGASPGVGLSPGKQRP